jgi:hypothetical protein
MNIITKEEDVEMPENTKNRKWPSPLKITEGWADKRFYHVGLKQGLNSVEKEMKQSLNKAYLLELKK